MYYNSIVDHYGISKIIIIIISIHACVCYTNHNTELSMAQLLHTIKTTRMLKLYIIIYHTAASI